MYAYIYIYIHIHRKIHVYMYVDTRIHMNTQVCLCMQAWGCLISRHLLLMCIYVRPTFKYKRMPNIYIYIYMYRQVQKYVYIGVHVNNHIPGCVSLSVCATYMCQDPKRQFKLVCTHISIPIIGICRGISVYMYIYIYIYDFQAKCLTF